MYTIISDIARVETLLVQLEKKLSAVFTVKETRRVNWPKGGKKKGQPAPPAQSEVMFLHESGPRVPAWAPQRENATKYRNFFLFGEPGSKDALNIAVQLNFPLAKFHMGNAGVFLEDESGQVWLGHTGKMTRVTPLKLAPVLEGFKDRLTRAKGYRHEQEVIRITPLDGPNLVKDLSDFADRARVVADRVHQERLAIKSGQAEQTSGGAEGKPDPSPRVRALGMLNKYAKEHSGAGKRKAVEAGERQVEHGAIVHALAELVGENFTVKNSKFVDLAFSSDDGIDLFEVKTSVDLQALYTSIGQLIVHGVAVAAEMSLPTRRYLVVPKVPAKEIVSILNTAVHAKVITYRKVKESYEFVGLPSAHG